MIQKAFFNLLKNTFESIEGKGKISIDGELRAELALEVFVNRIHKYIGTYAARMSGVDAIIFTSGIGENSDVVRERVQRGLEFMGVYWDPALNKTRGKNLSIIPIPLLKFLSFRHMKK